MRAPKIVKYINLSIAVFILIVLAAAYWLAYRPLPQTTGELRAPISQQATVARDAQGVPHITAATWQDAVFLQGYVTAQDRLWQMDALRRLAAGDLAEIVGPQALDADRVSRHLRMRRMAEEHFRTLPPADREVLSAYTRGVNFFIQGHLNNLPLEFTILRYKPRLWSDVDSILAGLQMYRNLTTSYPTEVQKQRLLASGDRAKVDALFPNWTGREVQPGSNAWAIAGRLTASGKPILANDPHLEWSVPSTWYTVHLKAPGLNVTGVSLPGVPCIIIGHNDRIAWGVTNLGFDVQDLYLENLDPRTGRYVYKGKVEQARLENDPIPVKGRKPEPFAIWVTRHGPVIPDQGNKYYALRWTAAEPGSFQFPFLEIDRASNWNEFTAGLKRFSGPGQNFVYADVDGNIGYHATGLLPIRRHYQGDVPADGSSGEDEWDGFISFEYLPTFYNPPSGLIVTANQNPFPHDYPYPVHGGFAPQYRSNQIRELLCDRTGWKPVDIIAVQKDVYSAFSKELAQQVVAACERRHITNADAKAALAELRSWNGQMDKDMSAPLIATIVYQRLRLAVANAASPGKGDGYSNEIAPAVIEQIVERHGEGWFKDLDEVLVQCLQYAVEEGGKLQGGNIHRWRYGAYNDLTIKQPVGSQIPLLGRYFNIGPIEMSGSPTTVKQTSTRLGPSMRFVADLSNWDNSLHNITVGESGQILSPHYKDQWNAYYTGRSFPMQFQHVEAKQTLTVIPR